MCSLCANEELELNYQDFTYNPTEDKLDIGFIYRGSCPFIQQQFFSRNELVQGVPSLLYKRNYSSIGSTVSLYGNDIAMNDTMFRLVAVNRSGEICSSVQSQHKYFIFQNIGKK